MREKEEKKVSHHFVCTCENWCYQNKKLVLSDSLACADLVVCVCVCEGERKREREREREGERKRACVSVCVGVCVGVLCGCECVCV